MRWSFRRPSRSSLFFSFFFCPRACNSYYGSHREQKSSTQSFRAKLLTGQMRQYVKPTQVVELCLALRCAMKDLRFGHITLTRDETTDFGIDCPPISCLHRRDKHCRQNPFSYIYHTHESSFGSIGVFISYGLNWIDLDSLQSFLKELGISTPNSALKSPLFRSVISSNTLLSYPLKDFPGKWIAVALNSRESQWS